MSGYLTRCHNYTFIDSHSRLLVYLITNIVVCVSILGVFVRVLGGRVSRRFVFVHLNYLLYKLFLVFFCPLIFFQTHTPIPVVS